MVFHASERPRRQKIGRQQPEASHQTSQHRAQPDGLDQREEIQHLQSTEGNQAVAQPLQDMQDEPRLSAQTANLAISPEHPALPLAETSPTQRVQAPVQGRTEETGPAE